MYTHSHSSPELFGSNNEKTDGKGFYHELIRETGREFFELADAVLRNPEFRHIWQPGDYGHPSGTITLYVTEGGHPVAVEKHTVNNPGYIRISYWFGRDYSNDKAVTDQPTGFTYWETYYLSRDDGFTCLKARVDTTAGESGPVQRRIYQDHPEEIMHKIKRLYLPADNPTDFSKYTDHVDANIRIAARWDQAKPITSQEYDSIKATYRFR